MTTTVTEVPVTTAQDAYASLSNMSLVLPANFPIALEAAQTSALQARVNAFDFVAMPMAQIATLGHSAEMALNKSLDGFLSRLDKTDAPRIFRLVEGLNQAVDEEKLPELANRILEAKPTLGERILGLFSKKALMKAMDRAYEDIRRVASGKTRKLSDVIAEQEALLRTEMGKVNEELRQMDLLKARYRESFVDFALETAAINNQLAKARVQAQPLLEGQDTQLRIETQDKLQALESRALALEGMMSRLPADQLVTSQLQNAGVATLQELATTVSSRFASIKMTLLTIHGALRVQDVQRLGQKGSDLDANLNKVRSTLMKDVVTTAANAPGKNRVEQAKQLQAVVDDTKALYDLVEGARASNQQKFDEARAMMAQARDDMLQLGLKHNPNTSYSQ